jgi:hypothetical protein
MKKIIPLCLCAALLLTLASCRGVAEKPFAEISFIPNHAIVKEESPGHVIMEAPAGTFAQTVQFYEMALLFVGAQQIRRDDTSEDYWFYSGSYGDDYVVNISIRDAADKVQILVGYLNEMQ